MWPASSHSQCGMSGKPWTAQRFRAGFSYIFSARVCRQQCLLRRQGGSCTMDSMGVGPDLGLLARVVQDRFDGTAAAVARRWPKKPVPHRSTISRWLRGATLPQTERAFLSFAGALDLDPFALWDLSGGQFPRVCARIWKLLHMRKWPAFDSNLSFLTNFVACVPDWPPSRISLEYFSRDWSTVSFSHQASVRNGYYAALVIRPLGSRWRSGVQVWHFAWRPPQQDALWQPYGFVRLSGADLRLFHFNSYHQSAQVADPVGRFCVETWFGAGDAEFRVASLHEFEIRVVESRPEGLAVVRFP